MSRKIQPTKIQTDILTFLAMEQKRGSFPDALMIAKQLKIPKRKINSSSDGLYWLHMQQQVVKLEPRPGSSKPRWTLPSALEDSSQPGLTKP
jgi:hypothetical protein